MKIYSSLMVAGSLLIFAPLAQSCEVRHHGHHEGPCLHDMDKNHDDIVSKKEFTTFHAEQFKRMDANRDGKLSPHEMERQHGEMKKIGRDPFDKRFEEVDINADGGLSKEEAEIGMPMLFKHFDEIDANKDGKMTKLEVIENMKSLHDKMPAKQGGEIEPPAQK